ncbi:MAG: hypothetical protein BWX80_04239 [Candidatus Hydrogenedentes bacterium ADurb.Bin101]|nr:MAG: hypothetical protein BWX80_04239 [Candidatus Hydrogenedentes bacterium ADurb.Bin101]
MASMNVKRLKLHNWHPTRHPSASTADRSAPVSARAVKDTNSVRAATSMVITKTEHMAFISFSLMLHTAIPRCLFGNTGTLAT